MVQIGVIALINAGAVNRIQIECVGDRLNPAALQDEYEPILEGIIVFGVWADEMGEVGTTGVFNDLVISPPGAGDNDNPVDS